MRTFSCFIADSRSPAPVLSFILAEDEDRARLLARRELLNTKQALSVEVCESGKSLWIVCAYKAAAQIAGGERATRPIAIAKATGRLRDALSALSEQYKLIADRRASGRDARCQV